MGIQRLMAKAAGAALMFGVGIPSGASASETVTYTYDARGRLVVVKSTGTVNNNQTHSYGDCIDCKHTA